MPSKRTVWIAGAILFMALLTGASAMLLASQAPRDPVAERAAGRAPQFGGPFVLTDAKGQRFDSAALKGKVALIFFGFTHCPDVCPTTLSLMTTLLSELTPQEAGQVQPVFISVDPARDTPEELANFGSIFDPRIIMLTGTQAEVDAVAKSFAVYHKRVETGGAGQYTMDHTASVFILDRNTQFRSTFTFEEKESVILEKVRLYLAQ